MALIPLPRDCCGVRKANEKEKDPDLVALGAAIRRARSDAGVTLEELADRADLSANYIGDLERGTRNVGVKALFKIARGLGVPPKALFAD